MISPLLTAELSWHAVTPPPSFFWPDSSNTEACSHTSICAEPRWAKYLQCSGCHCLALLPLCNSTPSAHRQIGMHAHAARRTSNKKTCTANWTAAVPSLNRRERSHKSQRPLSHILYLTLTSLPSFPRPPTPCCIDQLDHTVCLPLIWTQSWTGDTHFLAESKNKDVHLRADRLPPWKSTYCFLLTTFPLYSKRNGRWKQIKILNTPGMLKIYTLYQSRCSNPLKKEQHLTDWCYYLKAPWYLWRWSGGYLLDSCIRVGMSEQGEGCCYLYWIMLGNNGILTPLQSPRVWCCNYEPASKKTSSGLPESGHRQQHEN